MGIKGVGKQWIANLRWARDHCDNLVRVAVLKAKNPQANPKKILFGYADDSLLMRLTLFDVRAGLFRMQSASNIPA